MKRTVYRCRKVSLVLRHAALVNLPRRPTQLRPFVAQLAVLFPLRALLLVLWAWVRPIEVAAQRPAVWEQQCAAHQTVDDLALRVRF